MNKIMQETMNIINRSEKYQITFIPVEYLRFFDDIIPTLSRYKRMMGNKFFRIEGRIENFTTRQVIVSTEDGLVIMDLSQIVEMYPIIDEEE